ncbi:hypothetical protein [Serratia marcescens]|uniref:hypothetical protein n=1 Tax=Serratia marcescens TaxID=615 RepID=UPI0027E41162|nr:hypothetical protein [Serratia marcescens]HCL5501409.1 hypothetical protein [Klebsiella pneumoniae]EJC0203885.1 hypothetical protein [Serratia marcescens]WLS21813.1 hypothetical protein RAA91_11930 [Serratia marcescens]HCB1481474.1 hypothetical protein [Serratia marcescens]HCB1611167.1 hypothetical protein [Serratia marcescens]
MLITMEHIRAGGGCAWGLRTFFNRYNLDFQAFLNDGGISAEAMLGTGDALAIHIVELAQQQAAREEN